VYTEIDINPLCAEVWSDPATASLADWYASVSLKDKANINVREAQLIRNAEIFRFRTVDTILNINIFETVDKILNANMVVERALAEQLLTEIEVTEAANIVLNEFHAKGCRINTKISKTYMQPLDTIAAQVPAKETISWMPAKETILVGLFVAGLAGLAGLLVELA